MDCNFSKYNPELCTLKNKIKTGDYNGTTGNKTNIDRRKSKIT
jgi:hypothetical protein